MGTITTKRTNNEAIVMATIPIILQVFSFYDNLRHEESFSNDYGDNFGKELNFARPLRRV